MTYSHPLFFRFIEAPQPVVHSSPWRAWRLGSSISFPRISFGAVTPAPFGGFGCWRARRLQFAP